MKGTKIYRFMLVLGVLVLAAAVGITAVSAQEGEDEPLPDSDEEAPAPFGMFGGRHGGHHGNLGSFGWGRGFGGALGGITPRGQALADALDIPLEELEEAQEEAYANWLAEMVGAGYMDQEQADLMLAYNALKGNIDRHALTAQALGVSEEELTTAREEGTTLAQMLEDAGLTPDEFMQAMQEAYEAAVQAEVGESITQEQADMILESETGFGISGFGHGFHGFDGKGGGPMGRGLGSGLETGAGFGNGSGFRGSCPALSGTGL